MVVTVDWKHGLFQKQLSRPFPNSYFHLFYIYVHFFVSTSPGSKLNVIKGKQPLNEIVSKRHLDRIRALARTVVKKGPPLLKANKSSTKTV